MKAINLDLSKIYSFASKEQIASLKAKASEANKALETGTKPGNDFLGWVNLPDEIDSAILQDINNTANVIKKNSEVLVVVGIGGSYLGAKAIIEALSNNFEALKTKKENPFVVFAGQNISEDYMVELRQMLVGKDWSICVISKSGTTTEPALAFRVLKSDIEAKYGKAEAQKRIVAVTDASRGALKQLADTEGYKSYVIPDNVGGRFSVLTPVGLLAIAVAGFDVVKLVEGAKDMKKLTASTVAFEENIAEQYAAARNVLYSQGKKIEILANYNPKLHFLAEWWKQLYGESEGKELKGIFPASVDFTSDLHSMGQYIQEGERQLFETVLSVKSPNNTFVIEKDADNLDKLNFLAGKRIDEVNKMAELGTVLAHVDGGVPNIRIELKDLSEYTLGQLIYFFERACGISGYILGVNPFDQPGVEAYKKNMFALLGKPGFEDLKKELEEKLK